MPEVIKIEGGHTLEGEVTISSAKNATVACYCTGPWTSHNCWGSADCGC